jgi:hypothetical protein
MGSNNLRKELKHLKIITKIGKLIQLLRSKAQQTCQQQSSLNKILSNRQLNVMLHYKQVENL